MYGTGRPELDFRRCSPATFRRRAVLTVRNKRECSSVLTTAKPVARDETDLFTLFRHSRPPPDATLLLFWDRTQTRSSMRVPFDFSTHDHRRFRTTAIVVTTFFFFSFFVCFFHLVSSIRRESSRSLRTTNAVRNVEISCSNGAAFSSQHLVAIVAIENRQCPRIVVERPKRRYTGEVEHFAGASAGAVEWLSGLDVQL